MPAFLAAVPYILGGLRVGIPIAARAVAGGASTVGRTVKTAYRYRRPLGKLATTAAMAFDQQDLTRIGLTKMAVGVSEEGAVLSMAERVKRQRKYSSQPGGSSSSSSSNRKSSSGRAKRNSRTSNIKKKSSNSRPNRRTG